MVQEDFGSVFFQFLFRTEAPGYAYGEEAGVLRGVHVDAGVAKVSHFFRLYAHVAGNQEDFLRQTVAHEVAHLVAHQLFGDRIQAHGEEWQLIMRGVYELPPNRCHNYEVQRRVVTRYIYRCPCPQSDFPFTAQRHKLVRQGRRYLCKRCREILVYSGETRVE